MKIRLFSLLVILLAVTLLSASCITTTTDIPESSTTLLSSSTSTTTTNTLITTTETTTTASSILNIYFIDVGQGDLILIDYGEIEILIDGGGTSPGVVSFLERYIDGSLEVMVATHAHADHIGGLTAVLNAYKIAEIWHSGDKSKSKTYAAFMAAVNDEDAGVYIGKRGDTIIASDLSFTVLNPVSPDGTSNNNSLVLGLSFGDINFLFTGDAEQEAEESMLTSGLLSDVDILKVGHHGSRTASSPVFLAVIKPELAIYMCAIGNSYGHPHLETITALQQIGAVVCGTDVNGTIRVETDGHTYSTQIEKVASTTQ